MDGDTQQTSSENPDATILCMEKLIQLLEAATTDSASTSILGNQGMLELATAFNFFLARLFIFSNFYSEDCAILFFNFLTSRLFIESFVSDTINHGSTKSMQLSQGMLLEEERKLREKLLNYRDRAKTKTSLIMSQYVVENISVFYYPEIYIFSRLFLNIHAQALPLMVCGKVLEQNLGFKCQHCTTDKSSVICLDCFDESKHIGHEYRCFFSVGLCDCGTLASTGKTGVCARHVGDRQVKDPLIMYMNLHAHDCNLIVLYKIATFLCLALFQSIIFPIGAYLENSPPPGMQYDDDLAVSSISASIKVKAETSVQLTIGRLFSLFFVDAKIDSFWRIVAQALITTITEETTIGDIMATNGLRPFYYRDVESILTNLSSARMYFIFSQDTNSHISSKYGAPMVFAMMKNQIIGLVLSDILLSLHGVKVILDTEIHQLSSNYFKNVDENRLLLQVRTVALNSFSNFIVDGLIFEPLYRACLCNIFHWYHPYLLLEVFEGNCFLNKAPFSVSNFPLSFLHKPLFFYKYKPRFLQMHRAFAYGPVCIIGLNETIKYSFLKLKGSSKIAESEELDQYLIEEFYPQYADSRKSDVWTRAPVQIYTEFNPIDEVRYLISGYLLATIYLSMSIAFVPNYICTTRAKLFKKYISMILETNYIGCVDPHANQPSQANEDGILTNRLFGLIFCGLDEQQPYLNCIPNGFLPIMDHDKEDPETDRFTTLLDRMEHFFDSYMSSCMGSHNPVAYAGKMSNFTQACLFHLLPATAVLAIISTMSTIDAVQVMRGNHIERDNTITRVRHIPALAYSDFVIHFTYGAWYGFTHGYFYTENPTVPDDNISRKHCDSFKLSELKAKFGHNDEEIRAGDERILSFLKLLIMYIITINSSEAMSFEPVFQGGVGLDQECKIEEKIQTYDPLDVTTFDCFDLMRPKLEVYMYHPIFLPLHGALAYTLGAASTRHDFGISDIATESMLSQAIEHIVSSGYYSTETIAIMKIQLLNLCSHYSEISKASTVFNDYLKLCNLTPEEKQQAIDLGIYNPVQSGEYISPRIIRSRLSVWNQHVNVYWNEACLPGLDPQTRVALELVLLPFKTLILIAMDFSGMLVRSGVAHSNMLRMFSNSSGSYSTGVLALGNVCQCVLKYLHSQQATSPHGLEAFFFLLFNLTERRIVLERDRSNLVNVRANILKTVLSFLCFDYSPRSVENLLALLHLPKLTGISKDKTVVDIVDSSISLSFWREPTVMTLLDQFCDIITPTVETSRTDVYSVGSHAAYYQLNERGWAYTSIYSPVLTSLDYIDAWEQYCKESRKITSLDASSIARTVPVPQCVANLTSRSDDVWQLNGDYASLVSAHGNGLNPALTAVTMRIPCVGHYICQVFKEAILEPFTKKEVEVSLRPTLILCLCNAFFLLHHYTVRDPGESIDATPCVDPTVQTMVIDISTSLCNYLKNVLDSGISHCYFNDSVMEFLRTVMYRDVFQTPRFSHYEDASVSGEKPKKKGTKKLAFLKSRLGPAEPSVLMSLTDLTDLGLTPGISHKTIKSEVIDEPIPTSTHNLPAASLDTGKLLYEFVHNLIVNVDTSCYNCRLFDVPDMAICQPMAFVPNSLNRLYLNVLKQTVKPAVLGANILEHPWVLPDLQLFDSDLKPRADSNLKAENRSGDNHTLNSHFRQILAEDSYRGLVISKRAILTTWDRIPMSTSITDRLYDVPTVRFFVRVAGCKHFFHSECMSTEITQEPNSCFICRRFYNTYLPIVTSYKCISSNSVDIAKLEQQILEEFTLMSQAMAVCMSNIMYHGTATVTSQTQQLKGFFINHSNAKNPRDYRLLIAQRIIYPETILSEDTSISVYTSWYIMLSDLVLHNVFLALHGFSIGFQNELFTKSRLMTIFEGNLSSIGSVALLMQIALSFLRNDYAPYLQIVQFTGSRDSCQDTPSKMFCGQLHEVMVKILNKILDIQTSSQELPITKHMYGFVENVPDNDDSDTDPETIVYWAQGNSLVLTDPQVSQQVLNCNNGRRELSPNAQRIIPCVYNYARITSYLGIFLQVCNRMIGITGSLLFMRYLVRLCISHKLLLPGQDVLLPFANMVENPAVVFITLFLIHEISIVSITSPSMLISEEVYVELHQKYNSCASEAPSYQSYCQREALMARELIIEHAPLLMKSAASYNLTAFAEDSANVLRKASSNTTEPQVLWNTDLVLNILHAINASLGMSYQDYDPTDSSDLDINTELFAQIEQLTNRRLTAVTLEVLQTMQLIITPAILRLFTHIFSASHVLTAVDTLFGRSATMNDTILSANTSTEYTDYMRRFCMTRLRKFVDSRYRLTLDIHPSSYGLYSLGSSKLTPLDYSRRYLYKIFPFSRTAVEALKRYITDEHVCPYCKREASISEKRSLTIIVCMMCGQCFCNFCGHHHTNHSALRLPSLHNITDFVTTYNSLDVWTPVPQLPRPNLFRYSLFLSMLHHSAACILPAVFYLPAHNTIMSINGSGMFWTQPAPMVSKYGDADMYMKKGIPVRLVREQVNRLFATALINGILDLPVGSNGLLSIFTYSI